MVSCLNISCLTCLIGVPTGVFCFGPEWALSVSTLVDNGPKIWACSIFWAEVQLTVKTCTDRLNERVWAGHVSGRPGIYSLSQASGRYGPVYDVGQVLNLPQPCPTEPMTTPGIGSLRLNTLFLVSLENSCSTNEVAC